MGRALALLLALACFLVVGARGAQYDATADEEDVESITLWYKDWKLWIGIAGTLIGCYITRPTTNLREMKNNIMPTSYTGDAIFYLGLDLMILSVAQRNPVVGFIGIMAIIVLQSVIMLFYEKLQAFFDSLGESHTWSNVWKKATEMEIEVDNVFLDLPSPFAESFVRFLGQTVLIGYYWQYLFTLSKFDNLSFWLATLPVQLLAKHQMGSPYQDIRYKWSMIFSSCQYRLPDTKRRCDGSHLKQRNLELNIRCWQSWFVNHVYYQSLILSVPLMLMQSETGIDFVKDAFAVMFIPTLDDLSTPRILTLLIRTGMSSDPQTSDPESGALNNDKSDISELYDPIAA